MIARFYSCRGDDHHLNHLATLGPARRHTAVHAMRSGSRQTPRRRRRLQAAPPCALLPAQASALGRRSALGSAAPVAANRIARRFLSPAARFVCKQKCKVMALVSSSEPGDTYALATACGRKSTGLRPEAASGSVSALVPPRSRRPTGFGSGLIAGMSGSRQTRRRRRLPS